MKLFKKFLYFCLIHLTIFSCSDNINSPDVATENKPTDRFKVDTTIVHYVCENNTTVQVKFFNDFNTVNVHINAPQKNNINFTAHQDPAASGARYKGEKYTYWSKGQECIIEKNKKTLYRSCAEVITVEGMFSYFADANLLHSCDGNWDIPVASDSKVYLSLETRYLQLKPNGMPVYTKLKGYITKQRDEMGDDEELLPHFYIQEIIELKKDKKCTEL